MITKRYRIITAADPISNTLTNIGETTDSLVEKPISGGILGLPTIIQEATKWEENVRKQGASQEVINAINQAKDAFAKEEKLIEKLSARMGWAAEKTANFIAQLSPLDYNNPNATHLDRETLINALLEMLEKSAGMGLQGHTADVINYFLTVLGKSADAITAVDKVIEHLEKVNQLATQANLTPAEVFNLYFKAMQTNNFAPVYAFIAVAPLLGKNWWSFTDRVEINVNQMNAAVDLAEGFQGVTIDLSPAGKIVKKLNESFNRLKIAWLPIKKYIDMVLLTKVAKWNDVKAKKYRDNKERYQAFLSWQRGVEYDLHKFQDQFKFVNLPTTEAPGANVLQSNQQRRSNMTLRKIKIVVADNANQQNTQNNQAAQAPQVDNNDVNASRMQLLKEMKQQSDSLFSGVKTLYERISKSVADPTKVSESTDFSVFMSAFGPNEASSLCIEILGKIKEIYLNDAEIDKYYRSIMNNRNLEGSGLLSNIRIDQDKFVNDYLKRVTELREIRSAVEKLQILLPHVREMQIESKRLKTMQKAFDTPSNKFITPIMQFQPQGPNGKQRLQIKYVTKAEGAGIIWNLGMALADKMSKIASEFMAVDNENFEATANMMDMQAQSLATDINTWKDNVFMKELGQGSTPRLSEDPT